MRKDASTVSGKGGSLQKTKGKAAGCRGKQTSALHAPHRGKQTKSECLLPRPKPQEGEGWEGLVTTCSVTPLPESRQIVLRDRR